MKPTVTIPENLTGKALYNFLIENKSILIQEKKFNTKLADPFYCPSSLFVNEKGEIVKAIGQSDLPIDTTVLKVTSVINSCLWMDSHKDVHVPGCWNKSLSEVKDMLLLQEHSMTFKGIIADGVNAFVKNISWVDLGVNLPGYTECLVFVSEIKKSRNEFMFDQYRQGFVKNHSVGMRYVKLEMAINDEDYKEEFANWGKYIDIIANKSEAESCGYFWVVKEAKCIEGSAVPIGSNIITPTQSVESIKSTESNQPPSGTDQNQPQPIDWMKTISETKFININH